MKTTSIALIFLAGISAFSGVARADESVTAVNTETARVARESAGVFLGAAPAAESRSLRAPQGQAASGSATTHEDRAFLMQGDRGIGNN